MTISYCLRRCSYHQTLSTLGYWLKCGSIWLMLRCMSQRVISVRHWSILVVKLINESTLQSAPASLILSLYNTTLTATYAVAPWVISCYWNYSHTISMILTIEVTFVIPIFHCMFRFHTHPNGVGSCLYQTSAVIISSRLSTAGASLPVPAGHQWVSI